jgi:uncharacterized membrane protein
MSPESRPREEADDDQPDCGHWTGAPSSLSPQRLGAFSDGVIAVAATLLAFQLRIPAAGTDVWHILQQQWQAFITYAISFAMIGIIWINHHHLFTIVRRVDRGIQLLSMWTLMIIAFAPFPTAVLGRDLGHPYAGHAAEFYGLTFLVGSGSFLLIRLYLFAHPALVEPSARAHLAATIWWSVPGVAGYLVGALTAVFNATAALLVYVLAGVYAATRIRE